MSLLKKAKQYKLEATFKDQAIQISLKNKKNNQYFFNNFVAADIGCPNSIHPKVELQQIWQSLVAGCSPQSTNPKTDTGLFGEVISNIRQVPCFKVEPTGRIIVFNVFKNELTEISKTYRSILNLDQSYDRKEHIQQSKKQRKQQIRQIKKWQKDSEYEKDEFWQGQNNEKKKQKEKERCEYLEEMEKLKENYQICEQQPHEEIERVKTTKIGGGQNFDFDGVRLRYIGQNGKPSMFAFFKLLVRKGSRSYRIKIIENKQKNLKIGVLKISVPSCPKVLCTFQTIKGKKFLQNQTVFISLNNSKNLVQLYFENNPSAIESQFWKDGAGIQKSTIFVEMSNVGDTIYLLDSGR